MRYLGADDRNCSRARSYWLPQSVIIRYIGTESFKCTIYLDTFLGFSRNDSAFFLNIVRNTGHTKSRSQPGGRAPSLFLRGGGGLPPPLRKKRREGFDLPAFLLVLIWGEKTPLSRWIIPPLHQGNIHDTPSTSLKSFPSRYRSACGTTT